MAKQTFKSFSDEVARLMRWPHLDGAKSFVKMQKDGVLFRYKKGDSAQDVAALMNDWASMLTQ